MVGWLWRNEPGGGRPWFLYKDIPIIHQESVCCWCDTQKRKKSLINPEILYRAERRRGQKDPLIRWFLPTFPAERIL